MKKISLCVAICMTMIGCQAAKQTDSEALNIAPVQPVPDSPTRDAEPATRILTERHGEELQACGVYTKMEFNGDAVTLSNYQYYAPNTFCPQIAIPEDTRSYELQLAEQSYCGDTYVGAAAGASIKIVDNRYATCEVVLPGMFVVTENRNDETAHMLSKDDYEVQQPSTGIAPASRFLVESDEQLQACGIYRHMEIEGETAILSNRQYIAPNARCAYRAFDRNQVSYELEVESTSFCGDTYVGISDHEEVKIVDYRRATCELALSSLFFVTESIAGETSHYRSIDSLGGLDDDLLVPVPLAE